MHADRATIFSVGALTAQRATVAAHAKARESKSVAAGSGRWATAISRCGRWRRVDYRNSAHENAQPEHSGLGVVETIYIAEEVAIGLNGVRVHADAPRPKGTDLDL
jgi:hypothetical protein